MQRLKNTIYDIARLASIFRKVKSVPRSLLIVKPDEIGDYILWRNVLPCIRNSHRFKSHKITLCGNKAWKDIALHFDREFADDFIWLDKNAFKSDIRYRFKFLKNIHDSGFETLINPIFSRSPRVDDAIVKACTTAYKIGMQRNSHNVDPFEEGYDRKLYDEIFELPRHGLFEFNRNCRFISEVLKEPCRPDFGFDKSLISTPFDLDNFAVIFPGSGKPNRRWPVDNFVQVAKYVSEQYKLKIVLGGGKGDMELCREFQSKFGNECINLAGKTSLVEFTGLLSKAAFLISIDTGSVHLAAAAGCTVFGIFNGAQFGRFAPYPDHLTTKPFYSVYPDSVEDEIKNTENVTQKYQYFSWHAYEEITAEKVILLIQKSFHDFHYQ